MMLAPAGLSWGAKMPNFDARRVQRWILQQFTPTRLRTVLTLTSFATLLALYPEDVIKAVIGGAAVLVLGRGWDRRW